MVDAFPSYSSDCDYAVQMLIDNDLLTASCLKAAFEKDFPVSSMSDPASRVARLRNTPQTPALYPATSSAASRQEWILPLLSRIKWNQSRGSDGESWLSHLTTMLRLTLAGLRQVSEAEFLALADMGEVLASSQYPGFLQCMSGFTQRLDKQQGLSPDSIRAVREMLRLCDRPRSGGRHEMFVWPFFRSETGFAPDDPCWSACVRRNLAAMNPKLRNIWLRVFDCEHNTIGPAGPIATRSALTAAKAIEPGQMEVDLTRWIAFLHEVPDPSLSPVCVVIFRYLITLCDLAGGKAADELLYDIARIPWRPNADIRWIPSLLWAVGRRSEDRAFACLEALMMNPVTAIEVVRNAYDALMTVFGASAIQPSATGIDGYPLDSDPQEHQRQIRIDQLLSLAADAAARGPHNPPAIYKERNLPWLPVAPEVKASLDAMQKSILEEYSPDPAALHQALSRRAQWIAAHRQDYAENTIKLWNELFHGLGCGGGLLQRSLAGIGSLPLESLLDAIKTGGGNMKVVDLCREYVAKNGWHLDLVEALRRWIPTLGTSANSNLYRAQVEWFLWFEDVAPIQVDACWSHRVKRDLRAMQPKEHAAWQALLDNPTFVITEKPPKKWLQVAEPAFLKVGPANFRRHFVSWFEPFGQRELLRLTITGRNVLRFLMWYALVARDQEVDEALASFAQAKWKTAEVAKRAAQAEMAFSYVLSRLAPEIALPILERQVASGHAYEGSKTHRIYEEMRRRLESSRKPPAAS